MDRVGAGSVPFLQCSPRFELLVLVARQSVGEDDLKRKSSREGDMSIKEMWASYNSWLHYSPIRIRKYQSWNVLLKTHMLHPTLICLRGN